MTSLSGRDWPGDLANRFGRMDRMFDEWIRSLSMRRPLVDWPAEDMIKVDEYREGDQLVIKAEMPGVDPEKDIELTVADGMLRIGAQRRTDEKTEEKGYTRQELRYGSFSRTLALPEGVSEGDIKASYQDGILKIEVPMPPPPVEAKPKKIAIEKG